MRERLPATGSVWPPRERLPTAGSVPARRLLSAFVTATAALGIVPAEGASAVVGVVAIVRAPAVV